MYPADRITAWAVKDIPFDSMIGDDVLENGSEPDGVRRNNTIRAGRAARAVRAWAPRDEDLRDEAAVSIAFLMTDLGHLADALGEPIEKLFEKGMELYRSEVTGAS